jgi:hypothetical protein
MTKKKKRLPADFLSQSKTLKIIQNHHINNVVGLIIVYYVMRSKNGALCAAERSLSKRSTLTASQLLIMTSSIIFLLTSNKTNKHLRLTIKFNGNVEIASHQSFSSHQHCTLRSIMSGLIIYSVSARILFRKSSKLFGLLK